MTEKIEQKIEAFWRDATAGDAENGKGCVARFRDHEKGKWFKGQKLTGWRRKIEDQSLVFYDGAGVPWRQCQVYDPQQWYLDKPDPGEGYRLLEKFPPEELRSGFDDVYDVESQSWLGVATISSEQKETVWYRRRIEPVAQCPEPSPSIDNNVSVLCEVKLPVSCSVLGAITESLSKEYPGATMRQVGGHLRFERRVDQWHEES